MLLTVTMRRLTVALGLMLAAGLLAAGWPLSVSHAAEPEGGWRKSSPLWDVIGVGPHERSIELAYTGSGCGGRNLAAGVQEASNSVTIQVSEEVPAEPVICPAIALVGPLKVQLTRPLAGRVILGRPTYPVTLPGGDIEGHLPVETPQELFGTYRMKMPALIGFAPTDAEQVLALYGQRAKIRRTARLHGLPRVVAQKPRLGAPLPSNHTVRIRVSR